MLGYFRFYTECLGMKLLRKRDIPEERYTNVFLGYGPEDSHFVIELTYSKGLPKFLICLLRCKNQNSTICLDYNETLQFALYEVHDIIISLCCRNINFRLKIFQIMGLTSMISELDLAILVLLLRM